MFSFVSFVKHVFPANFSFYSPIFSSSFMISELAFFLRQVFLLMVILFQETLKSLMLELVFLNALQLFLFVFQCHQSGTHIYLSVLSDDNTNIFAGALLMSYCNFSPLFFLSVVVTTIFTSSNRLIQKCKVLLDGRVVSITKNDYGSAVRFL